MTLFDVTRRVFLTFVPSAFVGGITTPSPAENPKPAAQWVTALTADHHAAMPLTDKFRFPTVAALIADSQMSYMPRAGKVMVRPSDIIEAQGFRYRIASATAVDHQITTADGVKLYVTANDAVDIRQFGAAVDGLTNDQPAVSAAIDFAQATGVVVRFPRGTTLLSTVGSTQISKQNLTRDLVLAGEGLSSIVKRGDDTVNASFNGIFLFRNAVGTPVSVEIRDIKIDGNARNNGIILPISSQVGAFAVGETVTGSVSGRTARVVRANRGDLRVSEYLSAMTAGETLTGGTSGAKATLGAAPNPYVWQQSHLFSAQPNGHLGFTSVVINNVKGEDPTADSFSIGGNAANTVDSIQVHGVRCSGRERVRSDITITAPWNEFTASDVQVDQFEFEPNSNTPLCRYETTISNVIARKAFDCSADGAFKLGIRPRLTVSGLISHGFTTFGDFDAKIANFDIQTSGAIRFIRGRWKFSNGSVHVMDNGPSPVGPGVVYCAGAGTQPEKLVFIGTEFSAAPSVTIPYYFNDTNVFGISQEATAFKDCNFRGSGIKTAYIRSGKFKFYDCEHEFAGAAIEHGPTDAASVANEVTLIGNHVSNANGYLIRPPEAGNPVTYRMRGNTSKTLGKIIGFQRYDYIATPRGPGTLLLFETIDDFEADAIPTTGKWLRGARIWNKAPLAGGNMGWICTVSGDADGTARFTAMPSLAA